MGLAGGEDIEDALWLIKTGDSEVGPVSTDEMVAMIEAGEVSARTLVKALGGPDRWQRTDTTSLMGLARPVPRTANRLACVSAGVVLAGLAALASIHPASAQSRSGTTSPDYCGTAMVDDLARRIGGRVGTTSGNGTTDFVAPEIPIGESLSGKAYLSGAETRDHLRLLWQPQLGSGLPQRLSSDHRENRGQAATRIGAGDGTLSSHGLAPLQQRNRLRVFEGRQ
jgi:hypothetical protein